MRFESITDTLPPPHAERSFQLVRLVARVLATVLLTFLLFFLAAHVVMWISGGEELQPSGEPTGPVTLANVPGLIAFGIMTTGLAVSWWREGIGVVAIVLGLVLFSIVVQPVPTFIAVFGVIALLFAISWYGVRQGR